MVSSQRCSALLTYKFFNTPRPDVTNFQFPLARSWIGKRIVGRVRRHLMRLKIILNLKINRANPSFILLLTARRITEALKKWFQTKASA